MLLLWDPIQSHSWHVSKGGTGLLLGMKSVTPSFSASLSPESKILIFTGNLAGWEAALPSASLALWLVHPIPGTSRFLCAAFWEDALSGEAFSINSHGQFNPARPFLVNGTAGFTYSEGVTGVSYRKMPGTRVSLCHLWWFQQRLSGFKWEPFKARI